ncbi:SAM-dependent methyltransferase [Spirulina sp. CS-785/01]|uniref:SAM-dependent methyltransferase n=1 Tax=Spirulina sp. CS-785/01 TaxID=3021716 RepID=UPI00232F82C9|nr:SAM-dependent methyltransferase [Spirulina sp. CS-785/01]MDB9313031.1 SAM-dependent methyltransferase [Spirulina sp. CS-785/01]
MIRSPEQFVSYSAYLMAAIRAQETERRDRIFSDPFAAQLAGKEAMSLLDKQVTPQDQNFVVIRTRMFDDLLLKHAPPIKQVVILAAGMDTRAFRLALPRDLQLYELDYAEILEYKNVELANVMPKCERHAIAADLTKLWTPRLFAAGYDSSQASIWLLEGLLMYLNEADAHTLLQTVSRMTAPGSHIGLDLVNRKAVIDNDPYRVYFRSGVDIPEVVLSDYGWTTQVFQPGDDGASFGRCKPPPLDRDIPDTARTFIIHATKDS